LSGRLSSRIEVILVGDAEVFGPAILQYTGGFTIMKGNDKVIAALNEALHEELTALSQYFVHAEMRENWKYVNLAKYTKKLSIVE
jgi:CRISPR/Cas system CMR-associated protein Cmr3 (group 5 of RAMP superfamily)